MNQIALKPIMTESFITCPTCQKPIIRFTSDKEEYIGEDVWLESGDTIPGLWERLSEVQKTPDGFFYLLSVGQQPCCETDYFIIEAMFVNANVNNEQDAPFLWFDENVTYAEGDDVKFYTAYYTGDNPHITKTWHVKNVITEHGAAHIHTFGPYKLEEPSISACWGGINGKNTWDFASDLLYTLWDDLRSLTHHK